MLLDQLQGVFALIITVICLLNLWCLFVAAREAQYCAADEKRFRAYKCARTVAYSLLLVIQLLATAAHLWSHWPDATLVDASQSAVVLTYLVTLVMLGRQWRQQMSLRLSLSMLVALCEPAALLGQDLVASQLPWEFDDERIFRTVLHGLQVVVFVALLIAEVIIAQHHILTRSSLDGGAYQPLLGAAAAGRGGHHQQQHHSHVTRHPREGRLGLAMSAFQYVWPTSGVLRVRLAACFVLVLLERLVNLATPILYKSLVESLSAEGGPLPTLLLRLQAAATATPAALQAAATATPALQQAATAVLQQAATAVPAATASSGPWNRFLHLATSISGVPAANLSTFWGVFYPWAFFYLGAFLLRGGSGSEGLLANVRDVLWIPITQAAFRRISNDVFGHLLELDLSWHVHRKTGQIMRILDRGTSSIQDTVSIVLFNVIPQMVDILVACSYLAARMQPWVALIVLVTVSSYVPLTVLITERRGKVRKVMNALDNERESRATDMLLNYETVKYFCNEFFELKVYDDATRQYQAAEYWQMAFLCMLSMVQASVAWVGLAAGLVVCVWGIASGELSVGDTVLFITMMQQLYVPLTFFGSYYRQVQKALIDMENMFELLATPPAIQDLPGAPPLTLTTGRVDFQDVVFGYSPTAPVLKGVSFSAPGGSTVAVVGSTGSGKSTILRLLLRLYDPQAGRVLIDGQDIARLSQASVRRAIAVVPQDTVLFNDTILYNIRYGRPTASDSQVYEAAQVAHIHSHLANFPQGYATIVGERGLRLSGGEKQRVAFARALLKSPAILVLDEATSALDSLTERLIQASLGALRGRCTSVVVAHRLSTIMDADSIVVLERGKVVECGSHPQLIAAGGLYAAMWSRQQDSMMGTAADGGGEGDTPSSWGRTPGPSRPLSTAGTEAGTEGEEEEEEEEGGEGEDKVVVAGGVQRSRTLASIKRYQLERSNTGTSEFGPCTQAHPPAAHHPPRRTSTIDNTARAAVAAAAADGSNGFGNSSNGSTMGPPAGDHDPV